MLECLILGDSIAVGTAMFAPPQCVAYAHGGWSSWQWNRTFLSRELAANTVIISLGSNDHQHIRTEDELRRLREKVVGKRVYWILPHGNSAAGGVSIQTIDEIVEHVARDHGDVVIRITHVEPDNIHPSRRGYKAILETAMGGVRE